MPRVWIQTEALESVAAGVIPGRRAAPLLRALALHQPPLRRRAIPVLRLARRNSSRVTALALAQETRARVQHLKAPPTTLQGTPTRGTPTREQRNRVAMHHPIIDSRVKVPANRAQQSRATRLSSQAQQDPHQHKALTGAAAPRLTIVQARVTIRALRKPRHHHRLELLPIEIGQRPRHRPNLLLNPNPAAEARLEVEPVQVLPAARFNRGVRHRARRNLRVQPPQGLRREVHLQAETGLRNLQPAVAVRM